MANEPALLRLNPDLDAERFAEEYARNGLVRIPDILPDETAATVADMLAHQVPWRLVFPEPGPAGSGETVVQLDRAALAAAGREAMSSRMRAVMQRARENYGYLYYAYPMIDAYLEKREPGHPIHQLTEFLNSEEFMDFAGRVIGESRITKVDAQATYYAPGHFLTRHQDRGMQEERRAAYTFGFTRGWEPDWGGLLAFLDGDLNVSRAFVPRFNVLSFFDGRRTHAVTAVAPFAGAPRLQITGWLRDDPAAGPVSTGAV